jgi:3-oxoacyl-[acyl-carrier protein] reductase
MASLKGKVAIVTGASRGIGRAIAKRLARDGASVVINYAHSADKAKEVISAIEAEGGKALALQADLNQVAALRHLFQETIAQFGQLDILVNNAGTFLMKPLVETTEEEFDRVFALNTRGTFLALQEAALYITDGGRIVNISSLVTANLMPNFSIYAASKAAVEQLTIGLAKELGERGITVNAVSPGATETEMMPSEAREQAEQESPLGRVGQPSDIADVVAFVVSEEGRWLTGQNLRATGGLA